MEKFVLPTLEQVSDSNRDILKNIEKQIGKIPNFYAYVAKNGTALQDFLYLQNRKSTLRSKEKEAVSLITSQINGCKYCLAAHTGAAKMNGFTDEQTIEIRKGSASFDSKLDALIKLVQSIVENKGKVTLSSKKSFFEAGYSEETLMDVIILVGETTISNYIHNLTEFAIDFPLAKDI